MKTSIKPHNLRQDCIDATEATTVTRVRISTHRNLILLDVQRKDMAERDECTLSELGDILIAGIRMRNAMRAARSNLDSPCHTPRE